MKNCQWNWGRLASIGLICSVLMSGQAFGRLAPPAKKKKATPNVRAKKVTPAEAARAKRKRHDTSLKNHPFELDANAKLVCEKTTVTEKPIWRGRDSLVFKFPLHNAGTANLRIKAKGG